MARKRGTVTAFKVDRKYEGVGDLINIETPLMGLATNLDDTKREPTHAFEIYAIPDLKYGWINVPKEITTNLSTLNFYIDKFPASRIVGVSGNSVRLINTETLQELYSYTFSDVTPLFATLMNNISFACMTNASTNPLKVFFWTQNTIKEYNQTGNCMAFFKGRLFIGNGKTLIFSGASIVDPTFTENPFDSANGGGYIILNYPQVTKIYYLISHEDMLYIFTDGGLYLLTVSLASNAPSTFYIVETGINLNFSRAKVFVIENQMVVLTSVGLFWLRGLNLERFDWIVADQISKLDFTNSGAGYYQGQKIITIPYREENKSLAYSIEYTQFFYLPYKTTNLIYNSKGASLDFSSSYITQLFAGTSYYPFNYLSILHDLGTDRFKYIKELKLIGRGNIKADFIYDNYGLYQSQFYASLGPDLLTFRSALGRKGHKIGLKIYTDTFDENFAFVSKITMRIHVLGPVNYFYYAR